MEGINVTVQNRENYRAGPPSKKWWQYVSYFVLNASVVNNFILLDLNIYVYINRQM
jgi:hypothetical protein